jgi:hypothetical protein
MANGLAGKTALVTGGSTGIGFAAVQEFEAKPPIWPLWHPTMPGM